MARPTKLTPDLHRAIVAEVENGVPLETAAEMCGIHPSTFFAWVQRGKQEADDANSVYREFAEEIARARSTSEAKMLAEIRNAYTPGVDGVPDWRSRAWVLERTKPERYGQTVQVRAKVDDELQRAIDKLRQGLDQATFDRVVDILATDGTGEGGEGTPPDTDG